MQMQDMVSVAKPFHDPGQSPPAWLVEAKQHILQKDWGRALEALRRAEPGPDTHAHSQDMQTLVAFCQMRLGQEQPAPAQEQPAPMAKSERARMLLCCLPGLDNFVDDLISALAPWVEVRKLVSGQAEDYPKAMSEYNLVWIEWGNELAQWLTRQASPALAGKRVVLRIHSYEVLDGLADQLDFSVIDDLVFVAPHIRDILLARKPEVAKQVARIHVIPNGVDLGRFPLIEKPRGFNLAFLGQINFKKDPMVLMQAFAALHKHDQRYVLHIGGDFSQLRYQIAMEHFVRTNALEQSVRFHGRITDVPAWLKDKDYIICTSLMEGHPVGLSEAMAMGLHPLIFHWPGAEQLYPPEFLWNNLDDLLKCIQGFEPPQRIRSFVEANYSLDDQTKALRDVLLNKTQREFCGYKSIAPSRPSVPSDCFSTDVGQRANANKLFGLQLASQGFINDASVFLKRAWRQSRYGDHQATKALLNVQALQAHWEDLGEIHREQGMEAAARGDFETMLNEFYAAYYAAYVLTRDYRYMKYDPAIDTVLRLVAPHVHPIPPAKPVSPPKSGAPRVAIGLEGFDFKQAPIKMLTDMGRGLAAQGIEVLFVSRFNHQAEWEPLIADLCRAGCSVLEMPKGADSFTRLRVALGAMRQMRCLAFFVQTPWLIPWLNLLSMCGPAQNVIKITNQPGGWEKHPHYVLSLSDLALIDEVPKGIFIGVPGRKSQNGEKPIFRRRSTGELLALVVGRQPKLIKSQAYWRGLIHCIEQVPGLVIDVAGADESVMRRLIPQHPRLRFMGVRNDVPNLMLQHDLVIDTWPTGGGSVIIEAAEAQRPMISFRSNLYQNRTPFINTYNSLILPDLLLENFDPAAMAGILERLAIDQVFLDRITMMASNIPLLRHEEFYFQLASKIRSMDNTTCQPAIQYK